MRLQMIGVCCLLMPLVSLADQTLIAFKVDKAPLIDGIADDVWEHAKEIVSHDAIAGIDITVKAIYTDKYIALLAAYPDKTENRRHRYLDWNKEKELYLSGPLREDTLVFKWNMEFFPVDFSLTSDEDYKADIWYWKSYRTDHAGYADDKYQIYSEMPKPKSLHLVSKKGRTFFLTRHGDDGQGAYKGILPMEYSGDNIEGTLLHQPSGSRADIKAKGKWSKGIWTIEFLRELDTNHGDDIMLDTKYSYQFGVSRYEIAGRKPEPNIEIPLFGSGEITEVLTLKFQ